VHDSGVSGIGCNILFVQIFLVNVIYFALLTVFGLIITVSSGHGMMFMGSVFTERTSANLAKEICL
jgi:hypothetical protein